MPKAIEQLCPIGCFLLHDISDTDLVIAQLLIELDGAELIQEISIGSRQPLPCPTSLEMCRYTAPDHVKASPMNLLQFISQPLIHSRSPHSLARLASRAGVPCAPHL